MSIFENYTLTNQSLISAPLNWNFFALLDSNERSKNKTIYIYPGINVCMLHLIWNQKSHLFSISRNCH
jgi:hypothetical protein